MPEILNGSFETAGATPGEAQSWTLTLSGSLSVVASFTADDGSSLSLEQFDEGWGTSGYLLDPNDGPTGTLMVFDGSTGSPSAIEQFDNWTNGRTYRLDVNTGVSMEFSPDVPGQSLILENFDEGWSTSPWTEEPATDVLFEDTFDVGWSTDTWAADVVSGTDAMFDGGTNALESFENAWPDILFFVEPSTNLFTAPMMPSFGPPSKDFPVTIVTNGIVPDGLAENRTYYLRAVEPSGSGFTFQLSKTVGGAVIDILDAGSGTLYLHADPAQFWTKFEE